MEYDPNKLKEKQIKVGDRKELVVEEIESGKLSDFVKEEHLKKWENAEPESPMILVKCVGEDGFKSECLIAYPKDEEVHPKSKMGKWAEHYGKYPEVGQRVYVTCNKEGIYKFAVE